MTTNRKKKSVMLAAFDRLVHIKADMNELRDACFENSILMVQIDSVIAALNCVQDDEIDWHVTALENKHNA